MFAHKKRVYAGYHAQTLPLYVHSPSGEIACESDLRPEIGFNARHLEEEERFR
jgi:hypothetical protein